MKIYEYNYNTQINLETAKIIFEKLIRMWQEEHDESLFCCTWENFNVLLQKYNNCILKHGIKDDLISNVDIQELIKNDSYFSHDGIWVKKSKIPYIF